MNPLQTKQNRQLAVAATALLASLALTACSGVDHHKTPSASGSSAIATGLHTVPAARPTGKVAPPANGPLHSSGQALSGDLTAAVTTAQMSIGQVVQLHDIAISAGHAHRIPASAIPVSASAIVTALDHQVSTVMTLKPGSSTPQGRLAAALTAYSNLAKQLIHWNAGTNKPLSATFFTQLASADTKWKAALTEIGSVSKHELMSGVPTLLFPGK